MGGRGNAYFQTLSKYVHWLSDQISDNGRLWWIGSGRGICSQLVIIDHLSDELSPNSFVSLMLLRPSVFADIHFTRPIASRQTEIYILLSSFFPRSFHVSFSYISAPPWDRRTHWLKDVTIATGEKKQKKTLWGGRRREYSEMERDREGVNNLKTERKRKSLI